MSEGKEAYEKFKSDNQGKYTFEYLKSSRTLKTYKFVCSIDTIFPVVPNDTKESWNLVFNSIKNETNDLNVLVDVCNGGTNNYGGNVSPVSDSKYKKENKRLYLVDVYID